MTDIVTYMLKCLDSTDVPSYTYVMIFHDAYNVIFKLMILLLLKGYADLEYYY